MGFSNKTMHEPVAGKPHIAKRQGYWRVSPWKPGTGSLYHEAHDFAGKLNWRSQWVSKDKVSRSNAMTVQGTTTGRLSRPKVEDFVDEEPSPISGPYTQWFRPKQLVWDDPVPSARLPYSASAGFDRNKLLKHAANCQMGSEKLKSLMATELEKAKQHMREQHPILYLHCQNEDDENED